MKIIFTSLLMMIMAIVQAMPLVNDSLENGKKSKSNTSTKSVSSTTTSMQQVQEENTMLRARLALLETKVEDEKSMLQYKYTMLSLLSNLDGYSKIQKIEELQAQVNFGKIMSTTLLKTKEETVR